MLNGHKFERCNLFVIDSVKQRSELLFIPRESCIWIRKHTTSWWEDIYDRKGRFWKCFGNFTRPIKTETGSMKPSIMGTVFNDFREHIPAFQTRKESVRLKSACLWVKKCSLSAIFRKPINIKNTWKNPVSIRSRVFISQKITCGMKEYEGFGNITPLSCVKNASFEISIEGSGFHSNPGILAPSKPF